MTRSAAATVTTMRATWTSQRFALGDTAHPGAGVVDALDLRGVLRQHAPGEIGRVHAEVLQSARLHVDMEFAFDVDAEVDLGGHGRHRGDRDRKLAGALE